MFNNVGDIYNELHDIYKRKYSKKVDRLSAKNKIKFNYKHLRLSDKYLYSSEEEKKNKMKNKKKNNKNKIKKLLIPINILNG